MAVTRADIETALAALELPGGGTLVSRDMLRALNIDGGAVRFVIEAPDPEAAKAMEPLRQVAERCVAALDGVTSVSVALTAHGPAAQKPAPSLKLGGHPKPQAEPLKPAGVDRILVVGSGKGGVGKSTVSSNLAVALAKQGRKVGLLDADIYGPSQPRMMGVTKRPASPDGKTIEPLHAHGVTLMSIGLMLDPDKAVIWRGPMLMGALQQMLGQVNWGELDVLIVDLPPGTGDVQMTLCQRAVLTGAIIVSTPQDVALLDWWKTCRCSVAPIAAAKRISSVMAAWRTRPRRWACPCWRNCRSISIPAWPAMAAPRWRPAMVRWPKPMPVWPKG